MLKISCFLFVLLAGFHNSIAQTQTLNVTNNATGPNFVRFNDPSGLLNSKSSLEYGDIGGSCFWNQDWNPALLTIKNGTGFKLKKVRLNFYTNEVHYIDKSGTELAAVSGTVKRIVFYDRSDTIKVVGVFQDFPANPNGTFSQIFSEGKIQLLKMNTTTLKKDDYDPMVGKDTFHFSSTIKYFLSDNGSLTHLKGLSKKSILSVIKSTDEIEAWLKSNENSLKSENEIAAFLNYYNSIAR